jgi:nuclear autoantigenic sperm protein
MKKAKVQKNRKKVKISRCNCTSNGLINFCRVLEQTNGTGDGEAKANGESSNGHADESEAGPSRAQENGSSNGDEAEADEEGDEADDGGNLELAWEVLLNAEAVFERQGAKGLNSLMDVYTEMGGISLENGNFEVAVKDFSRALSVFIDLEDVDQNQRIAAELHYKTGLCQSMLKLFDESVSSFKKSVELLGEVIEAEKSKEQTEDVKNTIEDLEETQKEIQNKITEIGETKAEETEMVKRELAKLLGPTAGGSSSDGAGPSNGAGSSSSNGSGSSMKPTEAEKPKATDISHLIKRKKPDTPSQVEESPAKKMTLDQSPDEKKSSV